MGTRKSVSHGQTRFASIPTANIQRSVFDRSCGTKTTFNTADLAPIFVDEVMPGDTFSMDCTIVARFATLIFPIMDNVYIDTHWFFVPYRLVWDSPIQGEGSWQKFMGEQTDPGDSIDFEVPQVTAPVTGWLTGSVGDQFGLPPLSQPMSVSALPFRAYNLIYNEWFRSEDLVDSAVVNKGDGPDDPADYPMRKRAKRHDYFSSALPFPQKGNAVSLPLGTSAPVVLDNPQNHPAFGVGDPSFNIGGGVARNLASQSASTNTIWSGAGLAADVSASWNEPFLQTNLGGATGTADLTSATTVTINALRQSFQIQRLMERDARGGSRYTEIIRSHFNVVSPDQRLNRPEILGFGSQKLGVVQVANTAGASEVQGDLAAYGISTGSPHRWRKSFVEHGVVIGIVSARADLNYQQGIERFWSRLSRYDFYWPTLAHLGEQTILNKEIFHQGVPGTGPTQDEGVFGYQERYAEYRYKPSRTSGRMNSGSFPASLDAWHLAQDFSSLPVLDEAFIEEAPPVDRVIAVTTEPDFLLDSYMKFRCARPMPTYGVPGLVDHF